MSLYNLLLLLLIIDDDDDDGDGGAALPLPQLPALFASAGFENSKAITTTTSA